MSNWVAESTEVNHGSRHPWLWCLVGFLTLIGIAVAARRFSLLMSDGISADSGNPAKALDANFTPHRRLTLAHIIPRSSTSRCFHCSSSIVFGAGTRGFIAGMVAS